jgi:hypothetical protein
MAPVQPMALAQLVVSPKCLLVASELYLHAPSRLRLLLSRHGLGKLGQKRKSPIVIRTFLPFALRRCPSSPARPSSDLRTNWLVDSHRPMRVLSDPLTLLA